MRIGPTSPLFWGSSGRFGVLFPRPPRCWVPGVEIVRDRLPTFVQEVDIYQLPGRDQQDRRDRRPPHWKIVAGDESYSRNPARPRVDHEDSGARDSLPTGQPHPVHRRASQPKPPRRDRGFLVPIYRPLNRLPLEGETRPQAFPGASKSGTTTLDNGFAEVLSFPETQTMAQRNGFEMEEP